MCVATVDERARILVRSIGRKTRKADGMARIKQTMAGGVLGVLVAFSGSAIGAEALIEKQEISAPKKQSQPSYH